MASSGLHSRTLKIGPSVVAFESLDRSIIDEFSELFAGFSAVPQDRVDVRVQITVAQGDDGAMFYGALFDGVQKCQRASRTELSLQVTRLLNRHVLDNEPERLHLHAGAVTRGGATVLVLGSSFSGKSTLVAALVARGWAYLSDEQVGVTHAGELVPYPRPITLRAGSWQFFNPDWFPKADHAALRVELAPTKLGEVYRGQPIAPTVVICPDASEQTFACEQLTSSEAVARLLGDTLDLERAGSAGIQAMLSVAAQAPTFALAGRDLERNCATIDELSGSAQAPGGHIEHERVGDEEQYGRSAGALSWLFADNSASVYDQAGGAFLQLDHHGYRAWELLAHDSAHWPPGMAESDFLRELIAAGLWADRPS